jgi:hypothetical protein
MKMETKTYFLELVKQFGEFNNWKGYIDLYFTVKDMRKLKKLGVTKNNTIKEAYQILNK